MIVRTERLRLRPYRSGDEAQLLEFYSDDDVCRYLLHGPWTADDAAKAVRERQDRRALADGALNLVVELGEHVIGNVAAWFVNDTDHTVELGWVFSTSYSGRGYASEAVEALLNEVFALDRVHRATAQMDGRNTASARLAERVGMRREAHFREDWWSKGEWTDTLVFAVLRSDRSRTSEQ